MRIKRFEDLICWQEARNLVKAIYQLVKDNRTLSRDFRLCDQIIRAGISVMNNIAEGFDSQSNREFIRFLIISRRSISEIETCGYIALDQAYITQSVFNKLFEQAEKTRQIIDGFLRYLRTKRTR